MKTRFFIFYSLVFTFFFSCRSGEKEHPEWKKYFDGYKLTNGCFVLLDNQTQVLHSYKGERCARRFLPASTFKIMNSLIALQTKVAPDENFVLKWDSVDRHNPDWNHDLDMKTAIKVSAVWYYQELARRVGIEKIAGYLAEAHYGSESADGAVDSFWLNGRLTISPDEQVQFLKNLYDGNLPFSKRNIDIVKKITLLEDTLGYQLHGKTGWGRLDGKEIGWFVGWVEKGKDVYFFATNVEADSKDYDSDAFTKCRKEITEKILHELNIL